MAGDAKETESLKWIEAVLDVTVDSHNQATRVRHNSRVVKSLIATGTCHCLARQRHAGNRIAVPSCIPSNI